MGEISNFSFNETWTKRRLKNVLLKDFRNSLNIVFEESLKEFECNLLKKTFDLQAKRLCIDYKYTINDHLLIKEGLRVYNKIPLQIRKVVEDYETAHNIRTIWGEEYGIKNLRSQHFKIEINE